MEDLIYWGVVAIKVYLAYVIISFILIAAYVGYTIWKD